MTHPDYDTMSVIGRDGVSRKLFATRAEEQAAVDRSPLWVAQSLIELAQQGIRIHDLRGLDSGDVYDFTQCNAGVMDGDVLITDEGVAIQMTAWPVMVIGTSNELHKLMPGVTWEDAKPSYSESVLLAWALYCQ